MVRKFFIPALFASSQEHPPRPPGASAGIAAEVKVGTWLLASSGRSGKVKPG